MWNYLRPAQQIREVRRGCVDGSGNGDGKRRESLRECGGQIKNNKGALGIVEYAADEGDREAE